MPAAIDKLKTALEKHTGDWDFKFSYAPKPGQQRIKIVAQKIGNSDMSRTFIFTEELCKTLTTTELVRHVTSMLSSVPRESQHFPPTVINRSACEVHPAQSLEVQYGSMRRSYALQVSDLKEKTAHVNRPNLWLNLLGMSLRNLNLSRK